MTLPFLYLCFYLSVSSYYQLTVEYFMSSISYSIFDILSRGHLWTRVLASTPMLEMEVGCLCVCITVDHHCWESWVTCTSTQ